MKIKLAILLTFLFFYGCATFRGYEYELEPTPTKPEYTITVTINSIPSGADVYGIDTDGLLGAKIGTTPFVHICGVADRYWLRNDTKERLYNEESFSWGSGIQWKWVDYRKIMVLNIAFAKGNHSIAVASKELFSDSEERMNKNIALTVPLKTLTQVNREIEFAIQSQQLKSNRDQNIKIIQQKDGIDTVNSALDALIKYQGLKQLIK